MVRNATKRQPQVAKSTTGHVQRGPDLESPKPSFAFVSFNCLFFFRGILGGRRLAAIRNLAFRE